MHLRALWLKVLFLFRVRGVTFRFFRVDRFDADQPRIKGAGFSDPGREGSPQRRGRASNTVPGAWPAGFRGSP